MTWVIVALSCAIAAVIGWALLERSNRKHAQAKASALESLLEDSKKAFEERRQIEIKLTEALSELEESYRQAKVENAAKLSELERIPFEGDAISKVTELIKAGLIR